MNSPFKCLGYSDSAISSLVKGQLHKALWDMHFRQGYSQGTHQTLSYLRISCNNDWKTQHTWECIVRYSRARELWLTIHIRTIIWNFTSTSCICCHQTPWFQPKWHGWSLVLFVENVPTKNAFQHVNVRIIYSWSSKPAKKMYIPVWVLTLWTYLQNFQSPGYQEQYLRCHSHQAWVILQEKQDKIQMAFCMRILFTVQYKQRSSL